jgi:hypothetical protein
LRIRNHWNLPVSRVSMDQNGSMLMRFTRAVPSLFLLHLIAAPAFGQVQVEARLDKDRYLRGEPITVVVDVVNTGDEAVGYSFCDGRVSLAVSGAERRREASVSGCSSSFASVSTGSASGCAIDHPPLLPPGQRTSFKYQLEDYDLPPGQYSLTASGKAGVRWKYYPSYRPGVPPPRPPKHKESEPVPGAHFERTFPLTIVQGTDDELKQAFAPIIADADGPDPQRRHQARAAIAESAPPFLTSLIARYASEDQGATRAIEALGRIATEESLSALRNLLARTGDRERSSIVRALAHSGNSDNAAPLADVLQDVAARDHDRRHAALGLGYIGGDQAVRYLERAIPTATQQIRSSIATALGNSRSRMAVPVLIDMMGSTPSIGEVCAGLRMLTHRSLCGGTGDNLAEKRRWTRWWTENGQSAPIFGPDDCVDRLPPPPEPPTIVAPSPVAGAGADGTVAPVVRSVQPGVAYPDSVVEVSGYALGVGDTKATRILFKQGDVEHVGQRSSSSHAATGGPREPWWIHVVVPKEVSPGPWQIVVEVKGQRSAPVNFSVTAWEPAVLVRISPERAHPGQGATLYTKTPTNIGDEIELVDGRGAMRRIRAGVSAYTLHFTLPQDMAEGQATARVGKQRDGVFTFSAPLSFIVTSDPLPLKPLAAGGMTSVAPGQWTDLIKDHEIEFEVRRSDRIDVEFAQGGRAVTRQTTGPDNVHVQVPPDMKPGVVAVRTRTWIDQTMSEWSEPAEFRVLERPVPPSIVLMEAGPYRIPTWYSGQGAKEGARAKAGEALVLRGHFPVARAADLRVQLRGQKQVLDLVATDVDGGARFELPADMQPGEWRLMLGTADGTAPVREITTVRVM